MISTVPRRTGILVAVFALIMAGTAARAEEEAPAAEPAKATADKAEVVKPEAAAAAVAVPKEEPAKEAAQPAAAEAKPAAEPSAADAIATVKTFLDGDVRLHGGYLLFYDEALKKIWQLSVKAVRDPFKDEKGIYGALVDTETYGGIKRALEMVVRLGPDEKCGGLRVASFDVRKVDKRSRYELKTTPLK